MPNSRAAKRGRKIYIAVDFEGAACVIGTPGKPTEGLGTGLDCNTAVFKQAQRLVTAETNAAIRGALAAGATEIIVEDNHGCGHNLLYEELHPEAKVIMGTPRPKRFAVLDDSFDGLILLCHHAMAGARKGILAHSYSSQQVHRMILNGRPIGEIGCDAAIAGERGVPVIFVSSDDIGCKEAQTFLGRDLITVATKQGLGQHCALSLSPLKAQALTEEGVERAVKTLNTRKPYRIKSPYVMDHVYKWEAQADAAARAEGAQRLDAYRVRRVGKSLEALL